MGVSTERYRQIISAVLASVRRCPRLSTARREQRTLAFCHRWGGESRFDGCVADALHLAGAKVSRREVVLAGQEIVLVKTQKGLTLLGKF